MLSKYLETAVFLLKITDDPLILDAVRVFSTPKTPQKVVDSAQKYVENCYAAALTLHANSGEYSEHDLRPDRFASPGGD
jgi:hypothetical protein